MTFYNNNSRRNYWKCMAILSMLFMVTSMASTITPKVDAKNIPVTYIDQFTNAIQQSNSFRFTITHDKSNQQDLADFETRQWKVVKAAKLYGLLTLETWNFRNGDHYYFIRYKPGVNDKVDLSFELPILLKKFKYKYLSYPANIDHKQSVWSASIAASVPLDLPGYSVFAGDTDTQTFLSYIQVFQEKENQVKEEIRQQRRALRINTKGILLRFPHKANTVVKQWGMISAEPLADLNDPETLALLKKADLNMARKWTMEGPLEITPKSYKPYSASSFYINPSYSVANVLLKQKKGRFAENMTLLSLYTASRTLSANGYWPITTRSDWLYADYGIQANYYDTRWSIDAAFFLMKGFLRFKENLFLDKAKVHAEYYLQFADKYHYKTANGGILVWDYMQEGNKNVKPVHVSLNHLLAEMNFLYEMYQLTQEERYLATARRIKTAVQDTHISWKNGTGDLHYRYQPAGTYTGLDYPLLTLTDLRKSLNLIEQSEGYIDKDVKYLIRTKEEYLRKHKLPLR